MKKNIPGLIRKEFSRPLNCKIFHKSRVSFRLSRPSSVWLLFFGMLSCGLVRRFLKISAQHLQQIWIHNRLKVNQWTVFDHGSSLCKTGPFLLVTFRIGGRGFTSSFCMVQFLLFKTSTHVRLILKVSSVLLKLSLFMDCYSLEVKHGVVVGCFY